LGLLPLIVQSTGLQDVGRQRHDGRSLRATGWTHPFATRVKPETHKNILDIAERDGITLDELIEKAIEAYERG
jgi:predicted HicB family RNase H-like nuclease